jgi:hypothetical protein
MTLGLVMGLELGLMLALALGLGMVMVMGLRLRLRLGLGQLGQLVQVLGLGVGLLLLDRLVSQKMGLMGRGLLRHEAVQDHLKGWLQSHMMQSIALCVSERPVVHDGAAGQPPGSEKARETPHAPAVAGRR